ncbi:unnamed protein product [Schistosoma mattheei]|uniref:5'-nucleotidase n=1 Tax=Schistosoma mattheei TaxID=31246 RepID=A0A183PYD3_9TREM|nr:unnamed protein product [Schistosoma mattheei]
MVEPTGTYVPANIARLGHHDRQSRPPRQEIITDFDRTLSKYCHDGELVPTSYGIFESDPELTETAKSMLISLRNKYYPIELDNNLTENEKTPYMLEWWELAHEVIIECGIQKHTLERTVKECHLVLRYSF